MGLGVEKKGLLKGSPERGPRLAAKGQVEILGRTGRVTAVARYFGLVRARISTEFTAILLPIGGNTFARQVGTLFSFLIIHRYAPCSRLCWIATYRSMLTPTNSLVHCF